MQEARQAVIRQHKTAEGLAVLWFRGGEIFPLLSV